jgi:hypothetical protein
MMKRIIYTILLTGLIGLSHAQSINDPFFTKVKYIGAFGNNDWTAGWTNWNPNQTEYGTPTSKLGNGEKSLAGGLKITGTQNISGIVLLDGWVYVQSGGVLNIAAGTIVRGNEGACIIVERGGKIYAEGTSQNPIVFTSNNAAGERGPNDWAGIIILGKATNNKGTDVVIEGGTGATYGAGTGAVEDDNSGILRYVRIEFPGYDVDGNGNEINGLTMGSVGSGTTIEYVQVSYSGDDAFEWFGGNVNCKYLVAFGTEDDDFDTDYGYSGKIQFAVAVRDPFVSETNDDGRGFESDNDGNSSYKNPRTSAIFSNISLFGPVTDQSANLRHGHGLYLRRNTRLNIYNAVVTGYVKGQLIIDGNTTQAAAGSDSLIIQNTLLGVDGIKPVMTVPAGQTWTRNDLILWFMNPVKDNDTINNETLGLNLPVNITSPNFIPNTNSPVQNASTWMVKSVNLSAPTNVITTDGGSLQLRTNILPKCALDSTISWSIMPGSAVASISQSGLLTASSNDAGNGKVTVKAMTNDGSGVYDTLSIWISGQTGSVVLVNSIAVSSEGDVTVITSNSPLQMRATVLPENADVKTVTWSVTPSSNASINESGVLTPLQNGNITVTATATDGSDVSGSLELTINLESGLNDEVSDYEPIIHPNPVINSLNISDAENINIVEILNVVGNRVIIVNNQRNNLINIDCSDLNKGIYFVRIIKDENQVKTYKIIKQ